MNLTKIRITNASNEETGNHWTLEIPFEDLAEAITELERKTSLEEELDNLMDISIEIASNKRIKKDCIHPLSSHSGIRISSESIVNRTIICINHRSFVLLACGYSY